MGSIPITMSEC